MFLPLVSLTRETIECLLFVLGETSVAFMLYSSAKGEVLELLCHKRPLIFCSPVANQSMKGNIIHLNHP